MKNDLKLFMVMLGCRPKGRFTEQHDIFFGIGTSLKELIPDIKNFWPEAKGNIHIDVWREVNCVENYKIEVIEKEASNASSSQLFFINLGGYKENEFEEFHYKLLAVGNSLSEATKKSKETAFYKHYGFKGATSHIDDKFGIDIDDVFNVKEILSSNFTNNYNIIISKSEIKLKEDELHIGYLKIEKIS
ncbi:DUF1543 domain-containing protein [Flavobacterium sp.]|uniref:DUF1543 domain-containing protein n=1 Tax=Flavobacterium sp. TaxID=239 RepID=UPI003752CB8C